MWCALVATATKGKCGISVPASTLVCRIEESLLSAGIEPVVSRASSIPFADGDVRNAADTLAAGYGLSPGLTTVVTPGNCASSAGKDQIPGRIIRCKTHLEGRLPHILTVE